MSNLSMFWEGLNSIRFITWTECTSNVNLNVQRSIPGVYLWDHLDLTFLWKVCFFVKLPQFLPLFLVFLGFPFLMGSILISYNSWNISYFTHVFKLLPVNFLQSLFFLFLLGLWHFLLFVSNVVQLRCIHCIVFPPRGTTFKIYLSALPFSTIFVF